MKKLQVWSHVCWCHAGGPISVKIYQRYYSLVNNSDNWIKTG